MSIGTSGDFVVLEFLVVTEVGELLVGASVIVCTGARLLGVGVTGGGVIRAEVVGARVSGVLVFGGGGVADAELYWGTCGKGYCCRSQNE